MLARRGSASYRKLLEILKSGGVVVMACDTIYGFVGRAPDSEESIRTIKGRGETKPFLQLIPDAEALDRMDLLRPAGEILNLWPGPFTFVFRHSGGGSVACRVPKDARLRRLISDVDAPLFSTSVNRAGNPPMDNPAEIEAEFGNEVGMIEDSGVYAGRAPSTVVDLTVNPYRILRQGAGTVPKTYL